MLGAHLLLAFSLSFQTTSQQATPVADSGVTSPIRVPEATDSTSVAVRADAVPVIDGRDDDAVWRTAPPITRFRMWRPSEDKDPRYKTEAKVAYDAANLFVYVRAFDPHPDSIIKLLERRDTYTASDMIWLFIDSYHDRRTGFEFGVNAAGVKMDMAIYDDGNEDSAWDAVWDVATRVDSLGWTAEFKIPLSQMRYGSNKEHTFGFTIDRNIYRHNERVSWPVIRQSKAGFVSQFGHLHGMRDLESPRRLEAMPYVVTKRASEVRGDLFSNRNRVSIGGDVKYRVSSNITLDATVNPDFGQVEADPAVLNLSAYESFFDERRPFFVAGRGLFRFDVNCSQVNCNGEGLYYSRRIGRTPQLAGSYESDDPLQPALIIGAAKLTGRFPKGVTVGLLNATTDRVSSPGDTTFEPMTNFAVVRARQESNGGNRSIGAMLTAVNRRTDQWTAPYLASSAYAGAIDARQRFFKNMYEVSGSLDFSRVQGDPKAILGVQTSSVHYYQRPDGDLPLDSNRTLLTGHAEELKIGKVGGKNLMFETAYLRRSQGFEVNDLGYLQRADQQSWTTWVGLFDRTERKYYKRVQWNNNWWQHWTTDGLQLQAAYNTNFHMTFNNSSGLHLGGTAGQLGTTYDDRHARGGPAVRKDPFISPWIFINFDDRKPIVPGISANFFRGNGGRNWSVNVGPEVSYRAGGAFSSSLGFNWSHNVQDDQWFGRNTDLGGIERYTFAHLDQTTTSATLRLNYTFSPTVSLQAYTQPFVSKGTYSNVRQLSATPRAESYVDRYTAFNDTSVTNNPGGFNFKAFQSNVVFRYEYAPGSILFLVWNQGRQGNDDVEGNRSFRGDVTDLLGLRPQNTFLIKASYWLNR